MDWLIFTIRGTFTELILVLLSLWDTLIFSLVQCSYYYQNSYEIETWLLKKDKLLKDIHFPFSYLFQVILAYAYISRTSCINICVIHSWMKNKAPRSCMYDCPVRCNNISVVFIIIGLSNGLLHNSDILGGNSVKFQSKYMKKKQTCMKIWSATYNNACSIIDIFLQNINTWGQ